MSVLRTAPVITAGTILNNATFTSAEQDTVGDNNSEGKGFIYLTYTGTAAAGKIDVTIAMGPTSGGESTTRLVLLNSFTPISGTETNILMGGQYFDRYWLLIIKNNAIGASLTSVSATFSFYKLF